MDISLEQAEGTFNRYDEIRRRWALGNDHPALTLDLIDRVGARRAWRIIKYRAEGRQKHKRQGARRVRRCIRCYLRGGNLRIKTLALGNAYDIS